MARAAAVWQTPTCSSLGHNRSCVCLCVRELEGGGIREGLKEHASHCTSSGSMTQTSWEPDTLRHTFIFRQQSDGAQMTADVSRLASMRELKYGEAEGVQGSPYGAIHNGLTSGTVQPCGPPILAEHVTQPSVMWLLLGATRGGQFSKSILVILHGSTLTLESSHSCQKVLV